MEKDADQQSCQEKKKPLSVAERKAKQRSKENQLKYGTYQETFIEIAKRKLKDTHDLDLAALLQDDEFKNTLDDQQIQHLKIYINNTKQKQKKQCQEQGFKAQQQVNIKEKAQRLGNQQIPLLHQSLLRPQNTQERVELIQSLIQENLFLFLEYMENYESPTQDFLSIVISLYEKFDPETSTKLFVRVCAMHRGENLPVSEQMVVQAMRFLIESKTDNIAAFGLLRLVFQNDISFFNFSVSLLQEFQSIYEQTILSFYKSIPKLKFQLNESLPPTCFCFTNPILMAFKDGGDILHRQIPFQFLPYVIEIVCYSFSNNQESFQKFFEVFKAGCLKLYEILLQSEFQNLLQEISERAKNMEPCFFKTLDHATSILEKSFEFLKERKIEKFDLETIASLLDLSSESYQMIQQRPKIIKDNSRQIKEQITKIILQNNPNLSLETLIRETLLNNTEKNYFKAMGITNLLTIQEICFKYCTQDNLKKPQFIQFDTGQGKTSLCLGIATFMTSKNHSVFIINQSNDLLFRDFKKAKLIQKLLKIEVFLVQNQTAEQMNEAQITYINYNQCINLLPQLNGSFIKNAVLIIDEYDSIFFQQNESINCFIEILSKAQLVLAFSGGKLQQYHKDTLENLLQAEIVNFSLGQQIKVNQICHNEEVYSTQKEYRERIYKLCQIQLKKTPVIIIQNENTKLLKNYLSTRMLSVDNYSEQEFQQIDSSLSVFTNMVNGQYQVIIINEEQGRGLDFGTNSEIENNGGVYLIIACLPRYYLQFQQFIGRTGRIGNKGQYIVVLMDREAKNCSGSVYLNKKLLELQNNDILFVSQLKKVHKAQEIQVFQQNIDKEKTISQLEEGFIEVNGVQGNDLLMIEEISHQEYQESQENGDLKNENHQSEEGNDSSELNTQCIPIPYQIGKKRINKFDEKQNNRQSKRLKDKFTLEGEIDQRYFAGYADPQIHEEMLKDEVRMNLYEEAIKQTALDKIVIDVGAGSGVLSMFAAKYGAQHVFAIEYSDIAKDAQKAVKDNKLQEKITVIQERAEDVQLPVQQVDLIISEWMGYFLLKENMLPSVMITRDNYLKENGIIIPQRTTLFLAAISKDQYLNGLNLSSVGKSTFSTCRIEICKEEMILSESYPIFDFDLQLDNLQSSKFDSEFELKILKEGTLNGFVGWFDADLLDAIKLSTSPSNKDTHWKQTLFYLEENIKVCQGDLITGQINVYPNNENYRTLDIKISYKTEKMSKLKTKIFYME